MLTSRQLTTLRYITGYIEAYGYSPSLAEIAVGSGLNQKSKSGVRDRLLRLDDLGYIRRLPDRARAIEVLRAPSIPRGPEGEALYACKTTMNK